MEFPQNKKNFLLSILHLILESKRSEEITVFTMLFFFEIFFVLKGSPIAKFHSIKNYWDGDGSLFEAFYEVLIVFGDIHQKTTNFSKSLRQKK